jgi:dolichyl-phosphate-mannose--protein O-mannosyl transferase
MFAAYDRGVTAAVTVSNEVPAGPPERVPAVVRRRLAPFNARLDRHSWLATGFVTLIAALVRLYNLDFPPGKIFDETYYATEAQGLLQHGVEWDFDNNVPKYVVHPPLGKWCIALGEKIFGYDEFGWRISAAVAGIISVLMLVRIARRMFQSTVLGCAAGLLMAFDGMHFVMSRVALLDIFLMLFMLAAFGCLVLDRDARRRRWLRFIASGGDPTGRGPRSRPRLNMRSLPSWLSSTPWWRLASGVMFGCALGVKWSAMFFLPVMIGLVVIWEIGARRSAGVRRPIRDTFLDEVGWLVLTVVVAGMTYLATWTGWFLSDDGHGRHRLALEQRHEYPIVGPLWNLVKYHQEAFSFHQGLASPHTYQSWPWQWLLLGRPVAFYWSADGPCGSTSCAGEVVLLGTPVLWWSFVIALPLLAWFGIARRDWRALAIGLAIAANYVPWFYYAYYHRTMFYFYALPAEPFMILAVVFVLGAIMTPRPGTPPSLATADRRTVGAVVAGGYVLLVALCFAWFYPIYSGQSIPYAEWSSRMWLNSWI